MNRRFVIILAILALGLVFLGAGLTWAERAQGFDSLPGSSIVSKRTLASSNLSFSLGDPGTSYGYVSTIGTTEGPFLEDPPIFSRLMVWVQIIHLCGLPTQIPPGPSLWE